MKTKRILMIAFVMLFVLSIGSVAMAATASPSATTVWTDGTNQVESITVAPAASVAAMNNAVADYIAANFPDGSQEATLLSVDVTFKAGTVFPIWTNFNVAGVKVGDEFLVVHQKADGTIETLIGTVPANGVVRVLVSSASPFSIVKVVSAGSTDDGMTLPKTGDQNSSIPAVLLLCVSLVLAAVVGKKLINVK